MSTKLNVIKRPVIGLQFLVELHPNYRLPLILTLITSWYYKDKHEISCNEVRGFE